MAAQVCIERGCPILRPCEVHEPISTRNHRGLPRQERGLGADHDRARREMRGLPCALRLPGCTGISTSSDHIAPRSRGGRDEPGNRQPACAHCQNAQGAALARGR